MTRPTLADVPRLLRELADALDPQRPAPVADPDRDKAAEHLVFALYIYGGYIINSRGPLGCIMDAIKAIAPEVHAELLESDASEVHNRRWSEE